MGWPTVRGGDQRQAQTLSPALSKEELPFFERGEKGN
jgi:hypothetical protein